MIVEPLGAGLQETNAFLSRIATLPAVSMGDVPGVRQRRRLLASLFDYGSDDVESTPLLIGNVQVLHFASRSARGPLTIYVHGGGWVAGDVSTHAGVCKTLAAETQGTVISVDYRRPPEFPRPSAVEDVLVVLARTAAASPAGGRFALAGDSAGAHVAVEAALEWQRSPSELQLEALLLIQPACDPRLSGDSWQRVEERFLTSSMMRWYWDSYLGGVDTGPLWDQDLSSLPSTYVITSSLDPSCDDGLKLGRELDRHRVPGVRTHVPGLPHGCFTLAGAFPSASVHLRVAAAWLTGQVGPVGDGTQTQVER